jgi:hypothetical protein
MYLRIPQPAQRTKTPSNTSVPACGPTHTAVTPLDLVKCRRQVDANIYKSNFSAWRSIMAKEGVRGIFFGWVSQIARINPSTLSLTPLSLQGSHLRRLLLPRRRQIRRLRSLQILLRREALPRRAPNNRLPRCLRDRRIHRRHLPVSLRSNQSPHADHPAALRQQPP